jgi:aspartate/methionine/tyrosine aminotransferase
MKIEPFALERYFAKHEFSAHFLLSCSDCESRRVSDLMAMADQETVRLWDDLRLGYTESAGHPLLREAIAHSYDRIGAEEVLVVVPEEGIFLLMHALLRAGDHVVCTFPGYQSLYEVAKSIGCQVTTWEPEEEHGWRFDVEALEKSLRPDTLLVVANFPHNPTGYVPPRDDFLAIVDLVRKRGAFLLSDEMYRLLEIEDAPTLPAACDVYDRAVSLSGMSKAYGLPGLRIGWLASRDTDLLGRVAELKDYTTICSSAPSEILAITALQSGERILSEQRARVNRNVSVLDGFFGKYRSLFRWNRPIGGSVTFPRVLAVKDTSTFCDELIHETGILLVPSQQFQYGQNHVRVGFGRENLPQVVTRFGEYLNRRFG